MTDNKNAIIALLSADSLSNPQKIKELQENLNNEGFTNNSARYPNPDGIAGRLTRADIIEFVEANPEALLTMSASNAQILVSRGLGDELQTIVDNDPAIQEALIAQAKDILDGRNIDDLHGTPELIELQTKLKLLGEYDGRIDGFTGQKSRSAAAALSDQFAQAASPDQATSEPKTDIDVVASEPESEVEPEPDVEAEQAPEQSQTALYMTALGFREQGLKIGDGGERDWNAKRDPEVINLQIMLNRTGAEIAVDADYGPQTERAVKAFQEEHGLPVTGQADMETLTKLASLPETQFTIEAQENAQRYTSIEQHAIIADILPHVTNDTGVSGGYLQAVRGKETFFGVDLSSGTGSEGPFQFTGRTFTSVINKYGDQIAEDLRGIGQDKLADSVLASQAGNVDRNLRYDPYVATYAAAYFTRSNGVDTTNSNNWGRAYAAHNIGRGGLNTVLANLNTSNVGAVLDRKYNPDPAANNPSFFRGGANGHTVMNRYQNDMELWSGEYEDRVQPQLDALEQMQATELSAATISAQAETTPILPAGKPF